MRLLIAALRPPELRPTPRRHRVHLKSVEDVHGDEVLAPTEELSTPSATSFPTSKNATRQKHAIGYGSSTTYDKTSLTNELPYASATPAQTPSGVARVLQQGLENIKVIGYDMDYTIVHTRREWVPWPRREEGSSTWAFRLDLEFDDPDSPAEV